MEPDLGITQLARGYRAGDFTPGEVTEACFRRIAARDGDLNAFQLLTEDRAREAAARSDRIFAEGREAGPLTGIPFAIKDLFDLEGFPTGNGQPRTGRPPARQSAHLVQLLLEAGAIPLGKTRTVELAMGGWGINRTVGTPRNPWDPQVHRVPGGSSSGSAVAVAAGFVSFALGTDTGGSVRLPAAFCGVTGLNVTAHRLSTQGIMPLSHSLDSPGPIVRSVRDAAIVFGVMSGSAPGAFLDGDRPAPDGIAGLRLAAIDDGERALCSDEVLLAYDEALDTLRHLGASVDRISPRRSYARLAETIGTMIDYEAASVHAADYRTPDFTAHPTVRARLAQGERTSEATYRGILADRTAIQAEFLEDIAGFDALVTPTTASTAIPVAEARADTTPSHFTRPFNFLGMCGVAVPTGLTARRLPASLQVAARGGGEAMALRIAAAYEAARGPMPEPPHSGPA